MCSSDLRARTRARRRVRVAPESQWCAVAARARWQYRSNPDERLGDFRIAHSPRSRRRSLGPLFAPGFRSQLYSFMRLIRLFWLGHLDPLTSPARGWASPVCANLPTLEKRTREYHLHCQGRCGTARSARRVDVCITGRASLNRFTCQQQCGCIQAQWSATFDARCRQPIARH